MKEKKNEGFSLLELIIVIAILGIMGGILIGTAGNISGYKIKQYTEILESFMKKVRTDAMAKNNICGVCIYQKDNHYYLESYGEETAADGTIKYQTVEVRELGSQAGVEISVSKKDGSQTQCLQNNQGDAIHSYIRVKYASGTGAVADIIVDNTSDIDYTRFIISKGEHQQWIEINPVTGRITRN